MQDKGYDVTGVKCSTKFQTLKRTYKVVLDHNKKSGNNYRKWEYYKVMHELFADKPWVQPLAVAGSQIQEIDDENNVAVLGNFKEKKDDPRETCIKRRKLNTFIEQFITDSKEERKKRAEIRENQHNEKMNAFKRIENLMETFLQKKYNCNKIISNIQK
ncbi:uncharacterized protein LOC118647003 isoform X2 [Monomorium pharaonis]|uniref:uncharacterized protein LOC118647003 isoform X2 n=2 Tax=Monomorium pharaonis TaxID=307658 RepID=UPI001747CACC|nr:uncharacterized protein LOC118647003 isoform X2 [Monomorium pharaonis]